jgi:hypothetical protein
MISQLTSPMNTKCFRIGEDVTIKIVKNFIESMTVVFGGGYLRAPNAKDASSSMEIGTSRGS